MVLKSPKAFTLVEVLVCAYILLIGICGILLLYVNLMQATQSSWETTVAVSHAENVLEEMQNTQTLPDIIATDWDKWAKDKGLKTLPREKVLVVYANQMVDPLDIKVQVQWQSRAGANSITLETGLTK